MDYGPLSNLPDVAGLFTGERGSRYALHRDQSTTGYRTPSNHPASEPPSLQNKSFKTLFISKEASNILKKYVDDLFLETTLVPVFGKDNKLEAISIVATNMSPERRASNSKLDNPVKPNDVLAKIGVSSVPEVGLRPVEFGKNSFISPVGAQLIQDQNIHVGSPIAAVHKTPSKLPGKLGIAGALLGGTGAASAGEYRKSAGDVAESFMPLGLTPSPLGSATRPAGEREAEDQAYAAKKAAEQERALKAQALLRSGIPMPEGFAIGGRVRLI